MTSVQRPCRYPEGQCPFGNKCKFSHRAGQQASRSATLPATAFSSGSMGRSGGEHAAHWRAGKQAIFDSHNNPTTICKYFARGECMYGDKCRNRHDVAAVAKSPEPEACHFVLAGFCRFGDQCNNVHERRGVNDATRSLGHLHITAPQVSLSHHYKHWFLISCRGESCIRPSVLRMRAVLMSGPPLVSSRRPLRLTNKIWLGLQGHCSVPGRKFWSCLQLTRVDAS